MKNMCAIKKGFTLIELLAVIVILAIIALISTPIIINVIEKARKGAFEDSAYGVVDAAKLYFTEKLADTNGFTRTEFDFSNDMKDLKLGGEKPAGGSLIINDDGDPALAIYDKDKKWCAVKNFTEEKIRIIENYKKCDKDVAENLFVNGYGEYGNNTHFEDFTFNNGEFSIKGRTGNGVYFDIYGGNFIPVDPSKKYIQMVDAKATSLNSSTGTGLGFVNYDIDKKAIDAANISWIDGTTTYLTQDLKDGDTKVYLNDASHFADANVAYQKGFIVWNYKDSTGHLYPKETYSRNLYRDIFENSGIDRVNHVITLKAPWSNGTIPKGTYVSQSNAGGSHNYGLLTDPSGNNISLSDSYQTFYNEIDGTIPNNIEYWKHFREGTRYITFFTYIISNTPTAIEPTFTFKNMIFKEA